MNHHFRTIAASVITAVCCMGVSQAAYASEEETPIITFKTNIYELNGDANHFGITLGATENTFLDIDMGFGTEEHEVGVAVFNPETQAIEAIYRLPCQQRGNCKNLWRRFKNRLYRRCRLLYRLD